jgi:hypothetical protein
MPEEAPVTRAQGRDAGEAADDGENPAFVSVIGDVVFSVILAPLPNPSAYLYNWEHRTQSLSNYKEFCSLLTARNK